MQATPWTTAQRCHLKQSQSRRQAAAWACYARPGARLHVVIGWQARHDILRRVQRQRPLLAAGPPAQQHGAVLVAARRPWRPTPCQLGARSAATRVRHGSWGPQRRGTARMPSRSTSLPAVLGPASPVRTQVAPQVLSQIPNTAQGGLPAAGRRWGRTAGRRGGHRVLQQHLRRLHARDGPAPHVLRAWRRALPCQHAPRALINMKWRRSARADRATARPHIHRVLGCPDTARLRRAL